MHSQGIRRKSDRVSDAMNAIRNDLKSLQEATTVKYRGDDHREIHIEGDSVQHTAATLLMKTEKMNELDRQDQFDAIFRSVENKILQFTETLTAIDEDHRESKAESEQLLSDLSIKVSKQSNSYQDLTVLTQRLKSAAEQQESKVNNIERILSQTDTTSRIDILEKNVGMLSEELSSVHSKLDKIISQQRQTEENHQHVQNEISNMKKQNDETTQIQRDITLLKKYNDEFMELSRQSSTTFEGEIDSRLGAFDVRYTALLKHYHSTIMTFISGIQESVDVKTKSIYSTIEHDVNKLNDDINLNASDCRAVTDKLNGDVKTLSRRLLSGLRLLKDQSLDSAIISPSQSTREIYSTPSRDISNAFTPSKSSTSHIRETSNRTGVVYPTPSRPSPSSTPQPPSSVTAEIDQFLRGLETLNSGGT